MSNVTYLLGAGASANCLPTYINFKNRFSQFINTIQLDSTSSETDLKKEIIFICQEILTEFDFHNTPDTIAKKYFHKGDIRSLVMLKKVVILFFIYEQTLKNILNPRTNELLKAQFDIRYDSFLASILKPLKGELKIFNQFKVLTWNYDLQFEIAFANYSGQAIPTVQNTIQSFPYLIPSSDSSFDEKKFSLIHLNGIAMPFESDSVLLGKFHIQNDYPIFDLLNCYKRMTENINSEAIFSFAWEKYNDGTLVTNSDSLAKAIKTANNTDILVIIGYSFPIFNREIDKLLFDEMHSLRKIYVQSDQFEKIGNLIQNDFAKSKGFLIERSIINVGFTDQFFIPPEWDYKDSFIPSVA